MSRLSRAFQHLIHTTLRKEATRSIPPNHLVIIGVYPPPFGGESTHIKRLLPLLQAHNVPFTLYNAISDGSFAEDTVIIKEHRVRWLIGFFLCAPEDHIYIASRRLSVWLWGALLARLRNKNVMVRLQNAQLIDWHQTQSWRAPVAIWALKQLDGVICVNQALQSLLLRAGLSPNAIHHFPAFFPPSDDDLSPHHISPQALAFLSSHSPTIAANGRVASFHGQDLYGLDMLVELAGRLKPDHPNLGIIICFWGYDPIDEPTLQSLRDRALSLGVSQNLYFQTSPGLFVPILASSHVFIRPTNTDGDAISIREALSLGIPTVASDAAQRPTGCFIFRSRDLDHLEAQTRAALSSPKQPNPSFISDTHTTIDKYLSLLTTFAAKP